MHGTKIQKEIRTAKRFGDFFQEAQKNIKNIKDGGAG